MSVRQLGAAFALGAVVTHFLDPRSGRRRRAEARDRLVHDARVATDALDVALADLAHRSRGVMATARSYVLKDTPTDATLAERVRTRLGRVAVHGRGLEIACSDGRVELRGDVLESEVGRVLEAVGEVAGIRGVADRLTRHAAPDVPQLTRVPRAGRRSHPIDRWSPSTRLLVGIAGAAGVLSGLRLRGAAGTLATLVGGAAILRSATNRNVLEIVGVAPGTEAVLQRTLVFHAPIERVFAAVLDVEKFPRFMMHVSDVRRRDADHFQCTLTGPGALPLEWKVAVVERIDEARVRFVAESIVQVHGVVRFEPLGDDRTRVSLELAYHPALGELGRMARSLLGLTPQRAIDDDLLRLKSLLEQGKARGRNGAVTLEEVMPNGEA